MYLVFLGAPGAGKGTQAAIITKKLGLAHIASGDLFRQAVKAGTEIGKMVEFYMKKGELVPDEVTIRMILERIEEPDCKAGCIFDGFPRTLEQAGALDKAMAKQNKIIDKAVYIEVPEEELLKRLGGRWTCQKCQAIYHEVTSPPSKSGKCDKCDGTGDCQTCDGTGYIEKGVPSFELVLVICAIALVLFWKRKHHT